VFRSRMISFGLVFSLVACRSAVEPPQAWDDTALVFSLEALPNQPGQYTPVLRNNLGLPVHAFGLKIDLPDDPPEDPNQQQMLFNLRPRPIPPGASARVGPAFSPPANRLRIALTVLPSSPDTLAPVYQSKRVARVVSVPRP
jgi:hypothetical protein